MSNKNLAQEFLEAVKIIAADSVNSANMDQTVLMQVTKVPTETNKTYEVKYQNQTYSNVLSASSWDKDDFVYVLCPGGIDSTTQKTIISGLPKHKEIRETISTFEDIYQIIGAQKHNESEGFTSNNSIALSAIDKELLLAYLKRGDGLAISAEFLTAFPDAFFQHEDSEQCNFGIKVVLKEKKTINNEEKEENVSYVLDVNNMEGYPYLFTSATEQTEYFVIEHPENIIDVVSIECFLQDYPISSAANNTLVTMSNISVAAFYDYRKQTENKLIIFTKDNLQSIESVSNNSTIQTTLGTIFFSKQKFAKITYQWNKNDVLISIDGTSSFLAIPGGALLNEDNKFTCIVTIDDKDKYSNSYSIKNNSPLTGITINATRQTDNIDYYTVSVTPADTNIYTYQWIKIGANGVQTNLTTNTGASIVNIDATQINGSDTYRCLISYINYPIAYVETTIVQLIYSYSRTVIWFTASATTTLPASSIWVTDSTKTSWSADNKYLWKREDIYVTALGMEKLPTQGVPYISSVWGETGGSGNSAQLLRLQTSSYIFTRKKNGTGYQEDAITITAELINITEDSDGITWIVDGKTNPTEENIIINKKDHTLTIKNSYLKDDTQTIIIKASEDGKEDSLTITVLDEGNDSWNAILTNPVMNFNTNGTPTTASSEVYAYIGATRLPYGANPAGGYYYRVSFFKGNVDGDTIDSTSGKITLKNTGQNRQVIISVESCQKTEEQDGWIGDTQYTIYCTTVENGIDSYSLSLDNDSDIIVKDTTGKWISSFPITITATRYIGNKKSDEGSIIIAPSSGTGWSSSQNGVLTITNNLPIDTPNKEFTFTWKDTSDKTLDVKKFTLGVITSNADYELVADKTVINIDENKDSKINFKVKVKDNQGIHNATRSEIVSATTPFWFKEVYSDGTLSDVIYPKAGEDNSEAVWEVGPFTKDSVFRLYQPIQNDGVWENGFKWDEETIEVVRNGVSITGDPAYFIDLNNDSDVIARNNTGEIISNMPEVLATLMAGAKPIAATSLNLTLETNRTETADSKWWFFDIENNKGKLTFDKSKMPTTDSLDGTFTFKWKINNDTTVTKDFTLRSIASNVDYDLICSATSVNNSSGSGTVTFSVLKKSNTTTTLSAPSDDEPIAIYLNGSTDPLTDWKLDWDTTTQKTQVQLKSADTTWDEETIEFVQNGSTGNGINEQQIFYIASDQGTTPPDEDEDWENSIEKIEVQQKQYLWTKTVTTYTLDPNPRETFTVSYQGGDGSTIDGEPEVKYAKHNSGTAAPTSDWKDTIEATGITSGYYLWTKTTTKYKNPAQEVITHSSSYWSQDAQYFTLDAESPTFIKQKNGAYQKTTIKLTAHPVNLGDNLQINWYKDDTLISGVTGLFYDISSPGLYKAEVKNQTQWSDSISIGEVVEGSDAISIILTNPSMNFNTSITGESESCQVLVYEGATLLGMNSSAPCFTIDKKTDSQDKSSLSDNIITVTDPLESGSATFTVKIWATGNSTEQQPSSTQDVTIYWTVVSNGNTVSTSTTDTNYPLYFGSAEWETDWQGKLPSINDGLLTPENWLTRAPTPSEYPYYIYVLNYTQTTVTSVVNGTTTPTNSYSGPTKPAPDLYAYYNGAGASASPEQLASISAFMQLTKGGADQGIYYADDKGNQVTASDFNPATGQLYINAEYIKAGKLQVQQTINEEKVTHFEAGLGGEQPNVNIAGFIAKGTGPNEGYISKGKMAYNDDAEGVYLGTDGIGLGNGLFMLSGYSSDDLTQNLLEIGREEVEISYENKNINLSKSLFENGTQEEVFEYIINQNNIQTVSFQIKYEAYHWGLYEDNNISLVKIPNNDNIDFVIDKIIIFEDQDSGSEIDALIETVLTNQPTEDDSKIYSLSLKINHSNFTQFYAQILGHIIINTDLNWVDSSYSLMNDAIIFKKESILGKTRLKYTFSKLANYITFFGNVIQDTSSVETGQLRLKKRTTNSKFKLDGKGNISLQGNIDTSNIQLQDNGNIKCGAQWTLSKEGLRFGSYNATLDFFGNTGSVPIFSAKCDSNHLNKFQLQSYDKPLEIGIIPYNSSDWTTKLEFTRGSSSTEPEMTTIVFALQIYPFSSNKKLAIELKSLSGTIPEPAPEITVYYNQADETLANEQLDELHSIQIPINGSKYIDLPYVIRLGLNIDNSDQVEGKWYLTDSEIIEKGYNRDNVLVLDKNGEYEYIPNTIMGNITMIGKSFMPNVSGSASLGTENNAWQDIYLMINGTPKSLIDILKKGEVI